jgi:hypothetical protein
MSKRLVAMLILCGMVVVGTVGLGSHSMQSVSDAELGGIYASACADYCCDPDGGAYCKMDWVCPLFPGESGACINEVNVSQYSAAGPKNAAGVASVGDTCGITTENCQPRRKCNCRSRWLPLVRLYVCECLDDGLVVPAAYSLHYICQTGGELDVCD